MRFIKKYKFILVGVLLLPILISLKSVSAKDITINGLNKVQFGQASTRAIACDPDGINVALGSKYAFNPSINDSDFYLSDFTISDISPKCLNKYFTIYFSDTDGRTIENVAAKTGQPNISEIEFILRPVNTSVSPVLNDRVDAVIPPSIGATDYVPIANYQFESNTKQVTVNLDYHHFVPASAVSDFGIDIISAPESEINRVLVQALQINCSGTPTTIYLERILDEINLVIKTQLVPIENNCRGKWIQMYFTNPDGSRIVINKDYQRVSAMDACNRQAFGAIDEVTYYLPEQDAYQPLLSGSVNSYSISKIINAIGIRAIYLDFPADQLHDAWIGVPHLNVFPATCVKVPGADYYYPYY